MEEEIANILDVAVLGVVNDEDIAAGLLHNLLNERAPQRLRAEQYGRFHLEDLSDEEIVLNFRFARDDLQRLANALQIPNLIRTPNRDLVTGLEELCIYLRRLVYPNRLSDLESTFGLAAPYLSDICSTVMNIIHTNCSHLIHNLEDLPWLNYQKLHSFSQAIVGKGAALQNCWGFIDGTARPICRPTETQDEYFSGHKRYHCVKYQSVVCPDGITVNLQGPYPGRRHDAGILRDSGFLNQLRRHMVFPNDQIFTLYGDQAYGVHELFISPFANRNLTEEQQLFNNSMKTVREAVEWNFGKVINEFAFLDYKNNQKLLLQDVGKMYQTAVILTNCFTSLYGNQISSYFNIVPPDLETYLGANIL